jgi:hypothetical protein
MREAETRSGGKSYRAKGRYFFDALFVVDVFVAGRALLSEIENPSGRGKAGLGKEEGATNIHTCF